MSTITGFDPFAPEVIADPYPHYARLRDETPVAWIPEQNLWMVTRYDDVVAVLHDPSTYSSADGMGALMSGRVGRNRVDARELLGLDLRAMRVLIATDPPDHTRLRRLLARAFTPRAIAELEPHLREVCERLVDDLLAAADRGSGDLVAQLAFPFPVIVIAELLGIPPERRDDFKRWSDALVGALSGAWNPTEAQQTLAEMFMYLADVVERRRLEPGDDLISRLVAGADPDDPDSLSSIEITLFAVLLLVAGNETTTNLIGNAVDLLLRHPDALAELRADPGLIATAVEEFLRLESSNQLGNRRAARDTALGGVPMPAGTYVHIGIGAANRDPDQFPEPDRLDPRRHPNRHLAFGVGIHACAGMWLARMEGQVAIGRLVQRFGTIERAGAFVRGGRARFRGFLRYPVRLRP
jgi:cytochrome P450